MSEIINNSQKRKELLKHLIEQLHKGEAPEQIKTRLKELLKAIPYNEVVEVEQELINEGLPEEEVLKFCDIHTSVLEGSIDVSGSKDVPKGHPVDTFKQENRIIQKVLIDIRILLNKLYDEDYDSLENLINKLRYNFNQLSDIDKHYKRKEFLLFPFMEKNGITGPPKVMWGKHDETRAFLKKAHSALLEMNNKSMEEIDKLVEGSLIPALESIEGMIMKEEEILLPMCLDVLDDQAWYQIYVETPELGFCLYDPIDEWKPDVASEESTFDFISGDAIRLSTGRFDMKELEAIFSMLPVDISFVDKDDKVKFFSHSPKRVFERNRSVLGRDVRMCHPPGSVNIVEQIIDDFKSGKENRAAFWISSFQGRFVYIEYVALRGKDDEYLGVLEVTQDITELRKLEGDQRLLSYSEK